MSINVIERHPAESDADFLVRAHIGLARHLAHRYSGRGVEDDDLVQVASLALVKAAKTYESGRGEFAPFAGATVRGELKKYFRDVAWSVRPPRRIQELQAAIGAVGGYDEPDTDGLARRLDADRADVREALAARGCFHADSLERPVSSSGTTLGEAMAGDVGAGLEHVDEWVTFCHVSKDLDEASRQLLVMRYVEDLTQQQIADRIGVSQMQVSRRLRAVLATLRELADPTAAAA